MGSTSSKAEFGGHYGALLEDSPRNSGYNSSPIQQPELVISYIWTEASVSRRSLDVKKLAEQLHERVIQMQDLNEEKKRGGSFSTNAIHWLQLVAPSTETLDIIAKEFQFPGTLTLREYLLVEGCNQYMRFSLRIHGLDNDQFFEERLNVFLLRESQHIISVHQSNRGDAMFKDVYHKLGMQHSRLRRSGDPTYMMHEIIDAVIDNTFELVLIYEDSILDLERSILLEEQKQDRIPAVMLLRRTLSLIRLNMWRLRELLMELRTDEYDCISTETQSYLLQATDHCEHVVELASASLESVKDVEGLIRQGKQANADSTLMMLTSVSLFLMPAQFVTGIYGMNFDNMPELHFTNGYFFCISFIIFLFALVACYLLFFTRRALPILRDSTARESYLQQDYMFRTPTVFQPRHRSTRFIRSKYFLDTDSSSVQ